jgi:predicted MPP superfamily phosphohydrolase
MYQRPTGPLYVNPGIGYLLFKLRLNCRPELTVFEI